MGIYTELLRISKVNLVLLEQSGVHPREPVRD